MSKLRECLSYDDVQIIPKYSETKHRESCDTLTRFTKNTTLTIPIVSSPMDTITEYEMAKEMLEWGGVGVIHRFMSIEDQADMIKWLYKRWDSYFDIRKDMGGKDEERTADNEWVEWRKSIVGSTITKSDWEDLKERLWWFDSMKGDDDIWKKRPLCAAIGITGDYLERAQELVNNGCNVLLIDVAHGHHKLVKEGLRRLKNELKGTYEIIGGSIATKRAAQDLCDWGVDGVRVGIGNGSLCETRIRTGVGIPQVTTLLDVCSICDTYDVPVVADGGIRNVGDVCKGFGCGADTIMLGSLLSGTKETPGDISKVGLWPNEKLYKKYRGSASVESKLDRGEIKNVEGNSKTVPYKGKIKRIIDDIMDGLKSSMSYVGASNLEEYRSMVEFVRVTQSGVREAFPFGLNKE